MQSRKACLLASVISVVVLSASSAMAGEITVTPTNLDGWSFSNADNAPNTNASGDFEVGPSTPPLGIGSAQFLVNNASSSEILIQAITPTEVGNFSNLSYSTFVTASTPGSGAAPTLQFDLFEGTTYEGRLVFDPGLLGTVTSGTWQTWNASTADGWYLTHSSTIDPGNCSISGSYCTLSQVASVLDADNIDAVDNLFKAGSGQANFDGNVDAYTINSTTYNFDPATTAVPEPFTLSLFGAGLAGAAAMRRRKKAQKA
jgi:hypothetical protein